MDTPLLIAADQIQTFSGFESAEVLALNPSSANSIDVSKFSDLMKNVTPKNDPTIANPDEAVRLIDASNMEVRSMGEVILAKMDSVGKKFTTNMEEIHTLLEKSPNSLSLPDLLKLQIELGALSLEIDLVGKGVTKATQDVDQLSKLN
jgi:primase-polymerase (primpol)-like protein